MARDGIRVVRKPHIPFGNQNPEFLELATVLTADLPASGLADMDGRVMLEDAGAGDINLIVYAQGGLRFRIDGGTAF